MLAAVLRDFDRIELEDLSTPTPQPGEVLVRIKSCGFCATDYKAIRGIRRNVTFPFVPGHEPAGIVAAVGARVTHVREGDAVIVQPSVKRRSADFLVCGLAPVQGSSAQNFVSREFSLHEPRVFSAGAGG